MVIEFAYSTSVVVPADVGAKIMDLLSEAEEYKKDYDKAGVIHPIMDRTVNAKYISHATYCKYLSNHSLKTELK